MDEDVKAKLTAAWRAAVARLVEAGYDPADVYVTMISVGLSGAADRSTSSAVLERLKELAEAPPSDEALPLPRLPLSGSRP